ALGNRRPAGPQRLDLGSGKHKPRLEGFTYLVIEAGAAVFRGNPEISVLPGSQYEIPIFNQAKALREPWQLRSSLAQPRSPATLEASVRSRSCQAATGHISLLPDWGRRTAPDAMGSGGPGSSRRRQ